MTCATCYYRGRPIQGARLNVACWRCNYWQAACYEDEDCTEVERIWEAIK